MNLYVSSTACVSLLIMLALNFALAEAPGATSSHRKFAKRGDLSGLTKRLAKLTFIYQVNQTPADFIRSHPCVVGSWVYQKETTHYWIGDVHYVSDNTTEDSIRYVAFRLKVKKTPSMRIDMKKWRGRILLQKANPQASLDERSEHFSEFTVIGYSEDQKSGRQDGVIDLHDILPYKPHSRD